MFLGYNFPTMKRYWPLLAIAVVLAAIIGMSQYADSAKHRYEESTRQAKAAAVAKGDDAKATNNAENAYKPPVWAKFVTWPEGVGAWAVILTLFVIAWQSIETAKAANATEGAVLEAAESRTLAERTAKQQLRAYICMDTAEVKFVQGQLLTYVNFKNCGQTPAHEVQGWIGIEIAKYPPSTAFPKPLNAGIMYPKNTVGPETGTQFMGRRIPLMEFQLPNIFTPDNTLFAYGQLTYKDVFGDRWHTNFRLIAGGPEGARNSQVTKEGVRKWALSPDVEGNDAT
jgi:hypothetical protein